ncbi:hypothetical protein STEG23_006753, partial [Scotinomys teguina]
IMDSNTPETVLPKIYYVENMLLGSEESDIKKGSLSSFGKYPINKLSRGEKSLLSRVSSKKVNQLRSNFLSVHTMLIKGTEKAAFRSHSQRLPRLGAGRSSPGGDVYEIVSKSVLTAND